jgi:triacylglycerol lipase
MSIGVALDIAIGMITVFAVLSLAASGIAEVITQHTGLRGRLLRDAIAELLGRSNSACQAFYETMTIKPLWSPKGMLDSPLAWIRRFLITRSQWARATNGSADRLPSSIPPDAFASAVLEMIRTPASESPLTDAQLANRLCFPPSESPIARVPAEMRNDLARVAGGAADGHAALQDHLRKLFNAKMERLSGVFQRSIKLLIFTIALIIAYFADLDAFSVANRLATSTAKREAMVQLATTLEQAGPNTAEPNGQLNKLIETLDSKPLVGAPEDAGWTSVLSHLFGLIVTAAATNVGAKFWFDALGKLLRLRSAESRPENEERRAPDAATAPATAPTPAPSVAPIVPPEPAPTALTSGMTGFDPAAAEHNVYNARWCAELSVLAYQRNPAALSDSLRGLGFERITPISGKSQQCVVASTPRVVVVAFRGTEAQAQEHFADIAVDIDHALEPLLWDPADHWGLHAKAHRGFMRALDEVWDAVLAEVKPLLAAHPDATLWVTGHSLGGALAALCAARLEVCQRVRVHGLYTFGQPRCFGASVAPSLEERFAKRYHRYVNHMDPVPSVPFEWSVLLAGGEYRHVGQTYLFDGSGAVTSAAHLWVRFLDLWTNKESAQAGNQLSARLKEAVGHHGSARYRDLLRRQCGA